MLDFPPKLIEEGWAILMKQTNTGCTGWRHNPAKTLKVKDRYSLTSVARTMMMTSAKLACLLSNKIIIKNELAW